MSDDKSINPLIVVTPNHWHGPIAFNAVQAGKDVYVETPCGHVFREGQVLVQHGTKMRSSEVTAKPAEVLDSGILGAVKMSKAGIIGVVRIRIPYPIARLQST